METTLAGRDPRARSDSIFDEYRHRLSGTEGHVRELTAIMRDRNDRLFGSEAPLAKESIRDAPVNPVGPLAAEVRNALSSLDEALSALNYQIQRQGELG